MLTENLHHRVEGFTINILVYSKNTDEWTDKMLDILKLRNMGPTKLGLIEN